MAKIDTQARIKDMRFSFSRLNSFHTCKRMWYLQYVLTPEEREELNITIRDNFFGLYGTFAHKIFEMFNKGELEIFELADYCDTHFEEFVNLPAPPNKYVDIYSSYREKLLDYFTNFKKEADEVVWIEQDFEYPITISGKFKITFYGIIDALLKDSKGNFKILDYKSRSAFKNAAEEQEYLRQLLLYSKGVYGAYHKYPTELIFEMFKIGERHSYPFAKEALQSSLDWVKQTVKEMLAEKDYCCKCEKPDDDLWTLQEKVDKDFFCRYICNYGGEHCLKVEGYQDE